MFPPARFSPFENVPQGLQHRVGGGEDRRSGEELETTKVVKPDFNKEMLRSFVNTANVDGRHRSWTSSGMTGTHFVRPSARSGMGELVLQICRYEQGSQRLSSKWRQQG